MPTPPQTSSRAPGDTPYKRSAGYMRSANETRLAFDSLLRDEIRGCFRYDVPDYDDRLLLPSDPRRRQALASIVAATLRALDSPSRGGSGPPTPAPTPTPTAPSLDPQSPGSALIPTTPAPGDAPAMGSPPPPSYPPLRNPTDTQWLHCTSYAEKVFVPAFAKLWENLITLSTLAGLNADCLPLPRRLYRDNRTRYLKGSNAKRKLDFYVTVADAPPLTWQNVLFFGEMKDRIKAPSRETIECQMASYVREIFCSQPHRHFVHAFFANRSEMSLFRFDRAGVLVSERFDFHRDRDRFVTVVLALAYMDDADMGMDPAFQSQATVITPPPSPTFITPSPSPALSAADAVENSATAVGAVTNGAVVEDEDDEMPPAQPPPPGSFSLRTVNAATGVAEQYDLGDVLDSHRSLFGRGTICWKARPVVAGVQPEDKHNWTLKQSWPQESQRPEYEIYELAKKHGIKGLLDLHSAGAVRDAAGRPEDVLNKVRRGCTGRDEHTRRGSKGDRSKRKSKRKAARSKRKAAESKHKEAESKPMAAGSKPMTAGSKRKSDLLTGHEPLSKVRRTHGPFPNQDDSPSPTAGADGPPMNRVLTRLVFRDAVCIPLDQIRSATTFFKTIRDAILCHRDLYKIAGVLHRDISAYNILATTPDTKLTGGVTRDGVLIDFDWAVSADVPSTNAAHRTGTLPFLAVSVLKDRPNSYRADLESFFYVMCYVCCRYGADNIGAEIESAESESAECESAECESTESEQKVDSLDEDDSAPHHPDRTSTFPRRTRFLSPKSQLPLAAWEGGDHKAILNSKVCTLVDEQTFQDDVLAHRTRTYAAPAVAELLTRICMAVTSSEWFQLGQLRKEILLHEEELAESQREWERDAYGDHSDSSDSDHSDSADGEGDEDEGKDKSKGKSEGDDDGNCDSQEKEPDWKKSPIGEYRELLREAEDIVGDKLCVEMLALLNEAIESGQLDKRARVGKAGPNQAP